MNVIKEKIKKTWGVKQTDIDGTSDRVEDTEVPTKRVTDPLEKLLAKRKKRMVDVENPQTKSGLDLEFEEFEKKPIPSKEVCRMEWWRQNKTSLPLLFKVAQEILSVPCSSSKSERVFSQVTQVCNF